MYFLLFLRKNLFIPAIFFIFLPFNISLAFAKNATNLYAQHKPYVRPQTLNKVVAIVNNSLITSSEVENRMRFLQQAKVGAQNFKQALDELIFIRLQVQEAENTGLTISDSQLNEIIAHIAKREEMTVLELRGKIEETQSFASYRDSLRQDVQINHLQEREVFSKTQVFDSEVNSFLRQFIKQNSPDQTTLTNDDHSLEAIAIKIPQFNLHQIVLRAFDDKAAASIKALLLKLRQRIVRGEDFLKIAAQYSEAKDISLDQDGNPKTKIGEIGWIAVSAIPQELRHSIESLKDKELTEPLIFQNQVFLFQLNGRRQFEISPDDQRKLIRESLLQQKNAIALQDWLQQLRHNATIEVY